MDTSDSTVSGYGWEDVQPSRRRRLLMLVGGVLSTVLFVTCVVAALVRIPYDSVGPGSAKVVNDLVTVDGHEVFPPAGKVYFTTVSVRGRVSVLQALVGWLDPTTDVVPEEDIRGNLPPKKYEELNVQAMNDSKTTAEVLALSRIGFTNLGAGAEVRSIAGGSPAASVLRAKDVIVELDGKAIKTTDDAVRAIRARAPDDVLRIKVTRDGAPADLQATLTRAEDGTARLGVRLSTKVRLPFDIRIDSGDVVGPSAGLAYAIQLLDLLTPGELTGGVNVAATGELGGSGAIGPIGGVQQKVVTAKRAGAKVFLVPKENEAEAKASAGSGLQIFGVANFDEALAALGSMQGSNAQALAKPSAGT